MDGAAWRRVIVLHSSDELYGADRILLHVLAVLRDDLAADVEVWLPNDVAHGPFPLCERLDELQYRWRHAPLPILRRARLRPRRLLGIGADWVRTLRLLRAATPDAVYLSSSACLLLAPAARLAGVPGRLLHVQERWTGRSTTLVLRLLARWATTRVAISDYVASTAALRGSPVVVVPNAVDDLAAHLDGGVPAAGSEEGGLQFIVASRWNRWKGHGTLLRAWELAGCPGRLVIAGGAPPAGDGVDVGAMVADIVSSPETVEVIGEVGDIAPFLAAADVLVLPSDEPEPFGLVVIEAFSMGRPVIASRAGGVVDIIDEGENGWFFEMGDAGALAARLAGLAGEDVARAGLRAREAYERSYRPELLRARLGTVVRRAFSGEHVRGRERLPGPPA